MSQNDFVAIVVGQESIHNLRLSDLFRKLIGSQNVKRFLETRHLVEYLSENTSKPIGIFFDLFSYDSTMSTDTIGYIRNQYPASVFCMYVSSVERNVRWNELPSNWQKRLIHYYTIFKEPEDTELEPIVRRSLQSVMTEAAYNVQQTPIRLTSPNEENHLPPHFTQNPKDKLNNSVFISYSRVDWEPFVSQLVNRLRDNGLSLWIDQHLLVGGDDWMDAIGEALDTCKVLLLVMSPEALDSKFVKMEYRHFFNHDKTIVPLLYRPVKRIPPELSLTQYIDASKGGGDKVFRLITHTVKAKL